MAYLIGIALGDGNLSNPNGRAVRLRISCDAKYPMLIEEIMNSISSILPNNRVSKIIRKKYGCIDISTYSNYWEKILGWKCGNGSKIVQNVSIPKWIHNKPKYIIPCLRGLFQTDGSIYVDRGYTMVNFTNHTPQLSSEVFRLIEKIGYKPNLQTLKVKKGTKHVIRISKNSQEFIKTIGLWKK